jgi:hypothetical protein
MHVSKMTQHHPLDRHKISMRKLQQNKEDLFENSLIKEQIIKVQGGGIALSLPNKNLSQIKQKISQFDLDR